MKKTFLTMVAALLAATPVLVGSEWQAPPPELHSEAQVLPRSGSAAKWLWFQASSVLPDKTAHYRRTVTVPPGLIRSAIFYAGLDDSGDCWLNGKKISPVTFPQPDFQVKFLKYDFSGRLKPGVNLLAFEARNGAASGGLILRGEIRMDDGKRIVINSDGAFKAAEKVPPHWMKPDFDDSTWPSAMPFGDALSQPWYSVSDVFNVFTSPAEKARFQAAKTAAIAPPPPESAPDCQAAIVWKNGVPALEVNGETLPPATFLIGPSPWVPQVADMILKMRKAGFHLYEYQPASNRMYRAGGDYDFSFLDEDVRRILKLDPDGLIFIALRFDLFSEWMKNHPDDQIDYATGRPNSGGDLERRRAPSMASEAFRSEMRNFTAAFVEHLKRQNWFKRVIAMRVSHGVFSEWHYYGMEKDMPDTGPAMTKRFRAFLTQKYGTDQALRSAWHNSAVTLAAAGVPGADARRGKNRFLRDPASPDRAVLDYYRCHSEVVAETLMMMAHTVKEHAPKLLVGAYYGYTFGMPYPSEGLTLELDRVLSSPDIDFLSAPHCYDAESRFVGGDGLPRTLISTFRRYKKLHIYEADTRTHLAGNVGFGNARTSADSVANLKRDYANAWLNGCAVQFLEFNARKAKRCWFNSPEILQVLHAGLSVWRQLRDTPGAAVPQADIAVIFDPEMLIEHGYPERSNQLHMSPALGDAALHALLRSGYIFDLFGPRDYLAQPKNYRTVVFLNLVNPGTALREALSDRARQKGKTVIWCYAPGLVTEKGWDDIAMQKLTGLKLASDPVKQPLAIRLSGGGRLEYKVQSQPLTEAPRIFSQDTAAQVLGTYEHGGQAALVRKTLPDGSVAVFSGMPVTDAKVWTELLQYAGNHCYTNSPVVLLSGANGLAVHAARGGVFTLTLPKPVRKVQDLYGEPVELSGGRLVTLTSSGPQTWLLSFE